MFEDQDLRRIVRDTVSAYMPAAKLERFELEPYLDQDNEEGISITAVVAGDKSVSANGKFITDIKLDLFNRLQAAGDTRFPWLRYATAGELAHSADPGT